MQAWERMGVWFRRPNWAARSIPRPIKISVKPRWLFAIKTTHPPMYYLPL